MMSQAVASEMGKASIRAFTKALLKDLQALEQMLDEGLIESGVRRFGCEQEMFLVNRAWRPAPVAMEVLDRLDGEAFTTELARFNLELGPGRGILTAAIAGRVARLVAIELDAELCEELRGRFVDDPNVEIIHADFTTMQLSSLAAERGFERCALVGNIPYYLTRNVLFDFLVSEHDVLSGACIMLQREVGERIVSPPGSR
ncbi:MAG: methyltransferase domain-containing protein, partial [Gemmatimonadetes bacterium]|nr:methyltransferase domain-containing protein [Gemmatimonadota bacterium]